MITYILRRLGSIRAAAAVGALLPIFTAAEAYAQAESPTPAGLSPAGPLSSAGAGEASPAPLPANQAGGTAETERVIVTGSNIPTAEEVGPNPVLTLNRDLINKSGERSAEELIRNLSVGNAGGVSVSNNATGFTPGASTVALRGFDPRATLILIDGRRVAPYPIGIVGIVFVDLNSIPQAAIQSIEVLKDGASTTYGADAIAGVINLKLRHDYRGAEASIQYGNTTDKDSGLFTSSLVFGVGTENTQVTGVMNYYHRTSIFQRDRKYSEVPPFLSSNASPGNFQLSREAVIAAGGLPPSDAAVFFGSPPELSAGDTPASDFRYANGRIQTYNYNMTAGALPDSERYGGYVNFDQKVFDEQLRVYGDLMYQNVKTHNELAPGATGDFTSPGATTIAIPPNAPGPTLGGPTYEETGVREGAFNPFNPFQQIISGGTRYRLAEFGNRLFDDETDAFLTTVGVKGDKLFNGTWGYDGAFRYSQLKSISLAQQVSASRFNRILNANDPIFDPASPQFIGTTIPYNPFSDYRNAPANNAVVAPFAIVHPRDLAYSKLATLELTVYTTELFKLPAGGVGLAFGGQFRRESVDQILDQINAVGDTIGASPGGPGTHGGRKSYGIYAETSIPIFSPTNAIPGFRALEFTAAGRFESFLNNDTNVMVPKVGMRWQPFDESLTIRSTWGKGFRQPSLYELYAAPISALQPVTDTKTGIFNPETSTVTASNPNLAPEDSNAFTAGIVWTPKFVPGLTISLDLYDIERTGVVNTPPIDQTLGREDTGLLPGESIIRDAAGNLVQVTTSNQNSGAEISRGVDIGVQYQLQTKFGTFTSLTQATYLDAFLFAATTDVPVENFRGRVAVEGATSSDAFLKWRGRSRLDWSWNHLTVGTAVTYIDGFHEHKPNALVHWVKQEWLFDMQATYDFTFTAPVEQQAVAGYSKDGKGGMGEGSATEATSPTLPMWRRALNGTSVTVGCNNIFNQDPPQSYNFGGNAQGYPDAFYDPTGRFIYAQLTKKF